MDAETLSMRVWCWVGIAVILCGRTVHSTSYVAPRDLSELAAASETVVLARAGESFVTGGDRIARTHTRFEVLRTLRGTPRVGQVLDVETPGGEIDGKIWKIPGAPVFREDDTYLLCLCRKGRDVWITSMLSYGLLRELATDDGSAVLAPLPEIGDADAVPRPDGQPVEPIAVYRSADLLDHLDAVLGGREQWRGDSVRSSAMDLDEVRRRARAAGDGDGGGAAVPDGCNYFSSDGRNWRHTEFDRGRSMTIFADGNGDPSIRENGYDLIQDALDLWMNVSNTGCNLLFGGSRNINLNCGGTSNFIMFDDPCNDIADLQGCGGVLAFGGGGGSGTHSFDGTTWITMANWFIVMNNGVGCVGSGNYRILLAHELGHGLGFGHSQDSSALMFGNCCRNINGTDRTCVRYTYPSPDPNNDRPSPDAGSSRTLTLSGNTGVIQGTVSDDGLPAGGTVQTTWVSLDAPGEHATFSDASALTTIATFPESGRYLLGLIAHDGELLRMDQVFLDVEISGGQPMIIFQQGLGGYVGTVDTMFVEASPGSDLAAAPEIGVDADDPSGSGQATQVLLRFDDIVGEGPGQILPGTPIRSARLEFTSTDAGSGAALHRMRGPWADSNSWTTFGGDGIQAGLEAFVDPDAIVDGSDGGMISVDVTASVAAWVDRPCANFGWALLPVGGNGWDFFSSEGDSPPRLIVEIAGVVDDPLIVLNDEWDYFKGTSEPPAAWNQLGFEPGAGWLRGPTGIGYDDDDDATILDDMQGSYPSVFCRREFTVSSFISAVRLRIDYDDGFAAYLNGIEVARSANLADPGDPLTWDMLAESGHEAGEFEIFELDASLLEVGENVLAIQIHNTTLDSSDLSMRPELLADHAMVPSGADWRYLRGSSPLPADWNDPNFDDSGWNVGATGIGYGDGDDQTELVDMEDNYLTVFCRRQFVVPDVTTLEAVTMRVVYDDGIVVFVNGTEVDRLNMPAGPVDVDLAASGAGEPTSALVAIPVDLLVDGHNLLAVSVHNASLGSSDLSFDPVVYPTSSGVGGCGAGFKRGDASADGAVDVGDVVTILLHLFGGVEAVVCEDGADVNDDGELNTTDPVFLLTYLFQGGERPAAPGVAACGQDFTDDELATCPEDACAG
jgi:hypothetical protein